MPRKPPKSKVVFVKICAKCRKPIEQCCGEWWEWKRTLVPLRKTV
jgi:hypothetical protein